MQEFAEKQIKKELKIDAKALDIPTGAAEVFIENTLKSVKKNIRTKKTITKLDLERLITKELKKYNSDLAYVYKIRDKII
ncbi:hypothetical protein J6S37_02710 [Candidatus Saccharibacteria bacterium]|nr:hypothetical protein [Candidatus Saccharibacteria bacterium]